MKSITALFCIGCLWYQSVYLLPVINTDGLRCPADGALDALTNFETQVQFIKDIFIDFNNFTQEIFKGYQDTTEESCAAIGEWLPLFNYTKDRYQDVLPYVPLQEYLNGTQRFMDAFLPNLVDESSNNTCMLIGQVWEQLDAQDSQVNGALSRLQAKINEALPVAKEMRDYLTYYDNNVYGKCSTEITEAQYVQYCQRAITSNFSITPAYEAMKIFRESYEMTKTQVEEAVNVLESLLKVIPELARFMGVLDYLVYNTEFGFPVVVDRKELGAGAESKCGVHDFEDYPIQVYDKCLKIETQMITIKEAVQQLNIFEDVFGLSGGVFEIPSQNIFDNVTIIPGLEDSIDKINKEIEYKLQLLYLEQTIKIYTIVPDFSVLFNITFTPSDISDGLMFLDMVDFSVWADSVSSSVPTLPC